MTWTAALMALLISHAVGDVLFQTERQALAKPGGWSDPRGRRALLWHLATYVLAFIPALVWIGTRTTAGRAVAIGALVAVPHLLIDDGRIVRLWMRRVKGVNPPAVALTVAVDQVFHLLCLLGAALVAVA